MWPGPRGWRWGSGEWGGYRCSPELRLTGLARGWLVCSRKVTVVICSGQLSGRAGAPGNWGGTSGDWCWPEQRDYLHSRCFLYPCSFSKFSLLWVSFCGCNWSQSLRVSAVPLPPECKMKNDTVSVFVSPFTPLCFLMYFLLLTQCQLRWRSECNSAEHSVLWWLNWHPCPIFHGHCYWIWGRLWSLDWIRKIPACPWSNLAVPVALWRTEEIPESHLQCIIWRKATQLEIAWS